MSEKSHRYKGLRAVAIFEAAKAVLLLVTGFGLLTLINRDASSCAEYLIKHVHLNPGSKYPRIFIQAARQVTNANLWLLATIVMVDAVVRGIEAIGLWQERQWAKWLGLVTAAIYLPFEVYELWLSISWLKSAAFLANIVIVVYLAYVLNHSKQREGA